ncbi:MAG: hypothetical protein ACXABY_02025 [Candidatus Thorarchaeota archaeon]|jgi:hypothetical protein
MTKLITFSLWGKDPKYLVGAVKNAELAQKIYPDWLCKFYVGYSVYEDEDYSVVDQLESMDNVIVVCMLEPGDWRGMFWRFCNNDGFEDVDVWISRDCDSRLSEREAAAVQAWLDGPKLIHVMRDHPHHTTPILGGMWGVKKDALPDLEEQIKAWNQEDRWQTDQEFLRDVIWPANYHKVLAHDDWCRFPMAHTLPFPTPRDGDNFVGAIVGPHGERLYPEHHEML